MQTDLPEAGAVRPELARRISQMWVEFAAAVGLSLAGFDFRGSLEERLSWARSSGLDIGAAYARFSFKKSNSTEDQVRACMEFAAKNKIYVPPEFVSADEAITGRRMRRDGLERTKFIMSQKMAAVLLAFKVSRLFRQAYKGYLLFQELVESGQRGISVSQNIDTKDTKAWKTLMTLFGMMDELLIDGIADHVREGLKGFFLQGYVVGALPVGFRAVPVENAPLTKNGLPRTKREVVPEHADLIRRHFQWVADGMPIKEGWRRWVEVGGPVDPRCESKVPTCQAYRRMFDNVAYTGLFLFGRKRNQWSSRKDGVQQILQPNENVVSFRREDLRIVSDELFLAVQQKLLLEKRGKHRIRRHEKPVRLWDLVTDVFWCPHCDRRMIQYGASGVAMHCPMPGCLQKGAPRRDEAVRNVCQKLEEVIQRDMALVESIICSVQAMEAGGDQSVKAKAEELSRQIARLTEKLGLTLELAGEGSLSDREELKKKIKGFQLERGSKQMELARLKKALEPRRVVTPDEVRVVLTGFAQLLMDGASGILGEDAIYTAADVFRKLVGGRILVHTEKRAGRKRANIRGTFVLHLLDMAKAKAGVEQGAGEGAGLREVDVWLRSPPRLDLQADEVKRLYEEEGRGFREIGEILKCGSGNASLSYRRWFEMRGLPIPPKPTKTGRPRKLAS